MKINGSKLFKYIKKESNCWIFLKQICNNLKEITEVKYVIIETKISKNRLIADYM